MQITNRTISTILKHDSKQTSYKIALLRAINDVVLSFPDVRNFDLDVAVPLHLLAQFWLAYYWPFVDPVQPIMQGPRTERDGKRRSDMAFRDELTAFRKLWEEQWGGISSPSAGFFVMNDLRVHRTRVSYSNDLLSAYDTTLARIARTIEMPIRYAGPGEWTVFEKPVHFKSLSGVIGIPGTQPNDLCLVVKAELWRAFRDLSLWVEALCIHEWCLFTERVTQPEETKIDRGIIYYLLTARPDNRRPLTWERNNIDILLMEGLEFVCPWTERPIHQGTAYDLDHLVPIAIYPINELWNLVPADPDFNSHVKRDRLPSPDHLDRALPHLVQAYTHYTSIRPLSEALHDDCDTRFAHLQTADFPLAVAHATSDFIRSIIDTRNVAQF